MTLTLTDLFCGAGGSSTGAIQVPGVLVKAASNHWDLAVETHNSNHPDADHICADLSQINPRYFPTSDILWASPECTNHSVAKGRKRVDKQLDFFNEALPDAAAERSRATMWDVPRFAEVHGYKAIIVENVVDAGRWVMFDAWLAAMHALGYRHRIVWLNSMHANYAGPGAAQSRDRMYVVFWLAGNREPDFGKLNRPLAICPDCGPVQAMQSWKRPNRPAWGRYRAQYVYRCPNVACRNQIVEPHARPAAEIIDWTLAGQRIGDRPLKEFWADKKKTVSLGMHPLAPKTLARIQAGIDRYWRPLIAEAAGNTYDAADPKHPAHGRPDGYMRAWPVDDPLRTVHTTASKALAVPVEGREGKRAQPVDGPMRTMTTRNETGIAVPAGGTWRDKATSLDEPLPTRTTRETDGVAFAPFVAELRGGGSDARSTTDPLSTVTASGNHHGVVTPAETCWASNRPRTTACGEPDREDAFNGVYCLCERGRPGVDLRATPDGLVTSYYGKGGTTPTGQPILTVAAVEKHALLMRNNTARGDQGQMSTPVSEPTRTMTTAGHQSLLDAPVPTIDINDVLFRMLEPSEIIAAMDFPGHYVVLGNRREKVRMAGNAVTPCAARDLVAIVAESLGIAS